jgi:hypothetical protein
VREEASSTAGRLGEAIAHSSASSLLHRELGRGSALSLDGSRIEVELVPSSDKRLSLLSFSISFTIFLSGVC